ncbi:MAG TPA: urease accessory protein UreE [Cellvibrionales bacterium]|jgi:urease accessory protein|nr:urease accessory protein UreE [Cellvibrionales bacterium]|tara:strand:+ start:378 stop:830 length:453 start_codon:yes stop_codon:yes gene_type:complete
MFEIYERLDVDAVVAVDDQLSLDYQRREKGRLKTQTISGTEVRIFLDRGKPLQLGEILKTQCGKHIVVVGKEEELLLVTSNNTRLLNRACYHLGNRHVKIEVGEGWLHIQNDYVLAGMLKQLGLEVSVVQAIFNPEPGAYIKGGEHDHRH